MAKQIKAIECPKCGSTDKTEIKPDYFVCNNCGTEYFLDNDDININQNVNYHDATQSIAALPLNKKKIIFAVAFSVILFLLFIVLPGLFTSKSKSAISNIVLKKTSWLSSAKSFYTNNRGEPILVIAGSRNSDDPGKSALLGFVNMQTGKEIKVLQINETADNSYSDFAMQHFSNGDIYIIGNKIKIYKVEQNAYSFTDVTSSLLAKHPEMSTGIANAEFIFRPYGEGFKLINNEGKNYFYYPLSDKLYTTKEKQDEADKLEIKDPGDKLITAYEFTQKSSMFPEEPLQLIQYTKKDNAGGPDDTPWLEWGNDYSSSGQERSIIKFGQDLIRSWKDFTPGYNYFDPKLLYYDNEVVLYTSSATPAQNAPKLLKCLDVLTAKIKWTIPIEDNNLQGVVKCKGGFLFNKNNAAVLINDDGKVITTYSTI